MSIAEAFYYEAVHTVGVTAQIGDRLYPADDVPQRARKPYAVYQVIDSVSVYKQAGSAGCDATRLQVTCYADNGPAAFDALDAFRTAFEFYRGEMGATGAKVTVKRCFAETWSDAPIASPAGTSQPAQVGRMLDLVFHHENE